MSTTPITIDWNTSVHPLDVSVNKPRESAAAQALLELQRRDSCAQSQRLPSLNHIFTEENDEPTYQATLATSVTYPTHYTYSRQPALVASQTPSPPPARPPTSLHHIEAQTSAPAPTSSSTSSPMTESIPSSLAKHTSRSRESRSWNADGKPIPPEDSNRLLRSFSRKAFSVRRPWHHGKKQPQREEDKERERYTLSITAPTPLLKPRWQDSERLHLFEAIVKYKELDDMASFRWDMISVDVGRPKKACKDQWRREVLPAIKKSLGFGCSSNSIEDI
ncbi:hypothetical protein DFQ28_002779 [Apophysomyces sp. BC1034]|nr:hypothetical protein DFQ30_003070 [Apophysomyces sp. BC1015]KAG0179541.1 hypothetical protein DFQ29_001953 [Apophysomyces sp. BC1021]KAG0189894.1 hypothetical protein DFQ28_002779 [Apophysomyces sp. BC1034]